MTVLDLCDSPVGGAGDVDVVGACTRAQTNAGGRRIAEAPTRRRVPEVSSGVGPQPQPAICGRRDDGLVTGRLSGEDRAVDQAGVEPARHHIVVSEQEPQELDVGADTEHGGLGQRPVQ